jgi:hypothetical protein
MSSCIFCTVPQLICTQTPAYIIGIPVPQTQLYSDFHAINITQFESQAEFNKTTFFTPGSRLDLSLEEAQRLVAHRSAWLSIMNGNKPHATILELIETLENTIITKRLENVQLPKDWDIIKITKNEYVLNKRAAKILVESTQQFHKTLEELLTSLDILKTFNMDGKLLNSKSR